MRKSKRPIIYKLLLATLWILPGLVVLAGTGFGLILFWVDHRAIPSDLQAPPAEITRIIQPDIAKHDTPRQPVTPPQPTLTTETLTQALDEPNGHAVIHLLLNQDKPGARLYLQIKRELDRLKDKFGPFEAKQVVQYEENVKLWNADSDDVSPEQAQWLAAHSNLIDLIDQYCQTQGPGPVTRDEVRRYARQNVWIGRSIFRENILLEFSISSIKFRELLAATGRLAFQKGEYAQAKHYYLDLFKHSMITPCFDELQAAARGNVRLRQWIESGDPHITEWKEGLQFLDEFKKQCLTRGAYVRPLAKSYAVAREDYLESIKRGFNPKEWEDSDESLYYFSQSPFHIPNNRYLYLMYVKASLPRWLRRMDHLWQEGLAVMDRPWAMVDNHDETVLTTDISNLELYEYGRKSTSFEDCLKHSLSLETAFNLNRAALDLIFSPDSAKKAQTLDLHNDLNHPWRDPFTGQPFHVIESTTQTLIYSLGPDQRDQQGRDLRPQSQTPWSDESYDISIHVPRLHPK